MQPAERDGILAGVKDAMATTKVGIGIIKEWATQNREDIDKFAVFPSGYFGLVNPTGGLELYQGDCRLIDQKGNLLEQFPAPALPGLHFGARGRLVVPEVPLLQEDGLP